MDVVYLVGNSSKCNNNELRLSLRSLEKYASNIDRVIVVSSHENLWDVKNVEHYVIPNISKDRQKNINNCIIKLIEDKIITKDFVLMNDDFTLLSPHDFNNLGYYYEGDLWYKFTTRLVDLPIIYSFFMCNFMCDSIRNYDRFYPFRFEYEKLIKILPLIQAGQKESCKGGILIKSLYGNYYNLESSDYVGKKFWTLDSAVLARQYINEHHVDMMSVTSNAMVQGVLQLLYSMFPNKSKYE